METVLRVAIIYVALIVGLRVLGKREFSQLSPIEFVSLLLIPELLQQALVRDDYSLTNGLIGVTTLLILVFVTSVFSQRFSRLDRVLEGKPVILAFDGKLVPEALARERITPEELYSELRKSGLESIDEVKWAVLESDGKIAIVAVDEVRVPGSRQQSAEHPGLQ